MKKVDMRLSRSSLGKNTPTQTTPTRGGTKRGIAEPQSLPLKAVRPVIPSDPGLKIKLGEDLVKMKLGSLLSFPWDTLSKAMVRELVKGKELAEFKGSVRGTHETWTEKELAQAFNIPHTGLKLLTKGDNRISQYFMGTIDQCTNAELHPVLSFLIPIVYLEKPKRVTVRIGSTIIVSLVEEKLVNWASILLEVM